MPVYYFHRMQKWMVDFLQRRGFMGVFLMACWPNAAFDLCGICCGHFQMDFFTFFSATLLGKGFVLRPVQAAILVATFSHTYRKIVVHNVVGSVCSSLAPGAHNTNRWPARCTFSAPCRWSRRPGRRTPSPPSRYALVRLASNSVASSSARG